MWPTEHGGPDAPENRLWLCPATKAAVNELWQVYRIHRGTPPAHALSIYPEYAQKVVATGWSLATTGQPPDG